MAKTKTKLDRRTRRAIQSTIQKTQTVVASRMSNVNSTITVGNFKTGFSGPATSNTPPQSRQLPRVTGEVFPSQFHFGEHSFHLHVARHFHPDMEYLIVRRDVGENEISDNQLAFGSRADRDIFDAWARAYFDKFNGHTIENLPPPVNGSYPHHVHCPVKRYSTNPPYGLDGFEAVRMDRWLWALTNCTGEVRYLADFWFFEDDSDAALFELTFK